MNIWRICLVVVLIGVMALTFGANGCPWVNNKEDSGSSIIPQPVIDFFNELITMDWWQALSANYQNEGGLRPMGKVTISSTNYQHEGGLRTMDTKDASSTNYQNE